MSELSVSGGDALYVIVDQSALDAHGRDLTSFVETLVAAGARFIQYRAKSLTAEQQFSNAVQIRDIIDDAGGQLIINDRADVAAALGADGVHLPANGLPIGAARRVLPDGLVGVSTHDLDELKVADVEGADFVTYSPIWSPISKGDDRETHGEAGLAEAVGLLGARESKTMVYGLGGVTAQRAAVCRRVGAGAATLGAVTGSDEPDAVVREMLAAMADA